MTAKQPTISDDTSIKQFMQDVVIPKLEGLEIAVSKLVTQDSLELAMLKERNVTSKALEEVDKETDRKITKAFKNWVKVAWAVGLAVIALLVNTVWTMITNSGKL